MSWSLWDWLEPVSLSPPLRLHCRERCFPSSQSSSAPGLAGSAEGGSSRSRGSWRSCLLGFCSHGRGRQVDRRHQHLLPASGFLRVKQSSALLCFHLPSSHIKCLLWPMLPQNNAGKGSTGDRGSASLN